MAKRLVDFTKQNDGVVSEAAKEEKKAAYHAAQMPGNAGYYVGKNSERPLKCDCGQPRMRGTSCCQKCKNERMAEHEAQHEKYSRKD